MTQAQPTLHHGIVKQALSGDAIVIRGQPRGGPPPVRTVCFSNILAPRLARRPNPNAPEAADARMKDEPYAWEAREYVRKKLIGKDVCFTIEYNVPGNDREYGVVYLGKDTTGENITESLITEGLVEVRSRGIKMDDPNQQRLVQLEDTAKTAKVGKWSENTMEHIREIKWIIDDPRKFVDSHHGKPVTVVIEHVRDGCTVRGFVLPTVEYITVMMSGIKCPMFKQEEGGTKNVAEPFAEEAKFFSEVRLLQREVQIILEGTSNQNLLGTILHPNGSIAELLLKEGFARCVDWSMGVVSQGAEKLRAAEKYGKEKKMRIWKDYKPPANTIDISDRTFVGKVVEVVNGDSLVLKTNEGQYKKIFLSSIRPPRPAEAASEGAPPSSKRSRPLYDIPYMFEAREFLRKKLIAKKVNVQIDYVQPPNQGFPEKTCCTVTIGGINVAEAVISKGFGTVIRYRQDDDQRSSKYDELLAAEARAEKKGVGLHSKKDKPIHRVADISGDVPKAKQFLPFLQRAGRSEAVVEFVASGSRLRLYIPRETCLITFLISGIECPRGSRPNPTGAGTTPAEPYGEEALMFTKELCLQREVEVEVEAMDKGGNFIGWLYVDGVNLSVALVDDGLAKVHFTAERSVHYNILLNAEEKAKLEKKNIWLSYEEIKESKEIKEEPIERKVTYQNVVVTEVTDDLQFYAQNVDKGPQLEKLMEQLRLDMESNPPLPGAFTAKKGTTCCAKFSLDDQWYRAKILRITGQTAAVLFIDYGNKETLPVSKLATLSSTFTSLSPQAALYSLACIAVPQDPEAKQDVADTFYTDTANQQLLLNVEYSQQGVDYVTLLISDTRKDVAENLITNGLLQAEKRKEKRLAKVIQDYHNAQDKAKNGRKNIWRYGDFTEDDAVEFGYKR